MFNDCAVCIVHAACVVQMHLLCFVCPMLCLVVHMCVSIVVVGVISVVVDSCLCLFCCV